eukprot:gene40719-53871_t
MLRKNSSSWGSAIWGKRILSREDSKLENWSSFTSIKSRDDDGRILDFLSDIATFTEVDGTCFDSDTQSNQVAGKQIARRRSSLRFSPSKDGNGPHTEENTKPISADGVQLSSKNSNNGAETERTKITKESENNEVLVSNVSNETKEENSDDSETSETILDVVDVDIGYRADDIAQSHSADSQPSVVVVGELVDNTASSGVSQFQQDTAKRMQVQRIVIEITGGVTVAVSADSSSGGQSQQDPSHTTSTSATTGGKGGANAPGSLGNPRHIYKTACDTFRVQVGKGSRRERNGKFSRNARSEVDALWLCELALVIIDCPPTLEDIVRIGNYKHLAHKGLVVSAQDFAVKLLQQ